MAKPSRSRCSLRRVLEDFNTARHSDVLRLVSATQPRSGHILQLAGDAALRGQLGRRGQQFVRENFPVGRMVDELHALYQSLAWKA